MKRWSFHCVWTEWYFGIWWWPIPKNLAFEIVFGPLSITWQRDPRNGEKK